ncbi:DUF2147 domain-containing protein [Devosia nitrariae]|nr:DUF2147 domain-containing protein [Devosia nitrariae]
MKWVSVLCAVALSQVVSPVLAANLASPVGTWEIEMRDSRYQVEMCGENEDQLCGTLIWLGNGADNEENLPYLNTLLIDHAPQVGENRWRGKLHIFGQTATGTITQVSDNRIELEGCVAFVLCRTYQLYRID